MSVWCFLGSAGLGNDDFELLETFPIVEGVIGSDPSCALRLRDPMITPQHARVLSRDGAWFIGGIAVAAQTRINGVATVWLRACRSSQAMRQQGIWHSPLGNRESPSSGTVRG